MPYIPPENRDAVRPHSKVIASGEGELNFQITCLLNDYMWMHGLSYERMGDCIGACANAAAEFRRRVMDGYEDQKCLTHGDVYREGVRWNSISDQSD